MPPALARLKRLWRRAPLLTVAGGVALCLAAVFAVRVGVALLHWQSMPTDPTLAGWMTPRYVAYSWDVPPDVIAQALPIAPDGSGRRVTLAELAKSLDRPLPQMLDDLRAAIDAHRAATP